MDLAKMVVGCELCGALGNLLRCSGCKGVYYCSKEHQRLHWRQHKAQCNERLREQIADVVSGAARPPHSETAEVGSIWVHSTADDPHLDYVVDNFTEQLSAATSSVGNDWMQQQEQLTQMTGSSGLRLYAQQRRLGPSSGRESSSSAEDGTFSSDRTRGGGLEPPYLHRNVKLAPTETPVNNVHWVHTMCHYVIRDMDNYGICVIDNFVGHKMGLLILDEVLSMYDTGQFVDGKLMNNPSENFSRTIRGDKILWVTGQESHCKNIGYLIKLVDAIVLNSNRMPANGKLSQYTISDRSKAMVACYPGHGTQYVKHVDNPNKDGRCITSIYYLNQDWDVKRDGGLLRIFPRDWPQVADIEPVFDRILFFWSDRRNPHEVQPALRTRYAITLWYNDKVEKEAALRHLHGD